MQAKNRTLFPCLHNLYGYVNSVVTQVKSTRCLGVELDSDLNWNVHVKELIKSFTQKLNLLRSLYFLPTSARADFYFKVIYHLSPMVWLYGAPVANRSLMCWRKYTYAPLKPSTTWTGIHLAIRF